MTDREDLGPVDFVLIEFPEAGLGDDSADALIDLADRGIIQVYDFAIIRKDATGAARAVALTDLDPAVIGRFIAFDGASSGLLADDDIAEAAGAMNNDTLAVLIVFENSWAAPFGAAARRGGGQLIAFDRIPTQALIATLDELDAVS